MTPARWLLAGALTVIPLGLGWTVAGSPGSSIYISTLSVVPDYEYGGTTLEPGGYLLPTGGDLHTVFGAQSPARVLLVLAAVAMVGAAVVAGRRRSRIGGSVTGGSLTGIATAALLACDVFALADRASVPLLFLAAATILVVGPPLSARRRR